MGRREKGTYTNLDNPVVTYAKRHHDASVSVLVTLAERDNYSHLPATMKVPEIMLETDLGQRAIEKGLVHLEGLGLAARDGNGWAYSGANCRANREANGGANEEANQRANDCANDRANGNANDGANSRSLGPKGNTDQDSENTPLKEVEGLRRNTDQKNPPTPPRGADGEEQASPDQVQTPSPDADVPPPTDPEKIPRRRAAVLALPDDLAALPGVPDAWALWVTYRRQSGLKTPDTTATEQFRKLRELHAAGWDLPHVITHAIELQWKSFFPIRGERPGPPRTSALAAASPPPTASRTREEWLS